MPDLGEPFDERGAATDSGLRAMRDELITTLESVVTRGFRSSFALSALFAAARAPSGLAAEEERVTRPARVLVALLVAVGVLIAAELALGALSFGETRIADPCTTSADLRREWRRRRRFSASPCPPSAARRASSGPVARSSCSRSSRRQRCGPCAGTRRRSTGRSATGVERAVEGHGGQRPARRRAPRPARQDPRRPARLDPRPGRRLGSLAWRLNYQDMIAALQAYWAEHGCAIMQPYHTELGAGTFNPATFLRCLGPDPWRAAYVEPCIRPTDGRYGENPFRFQHYFQYQVILKPAPDDVLDLYFGSLAALGIDLVRHDVRLVEDDWEQPTLGAWGLGWEVWSTAWRSRSSRTSSSSAGSTSTSIPAEITYGLERLAMFLQGKRTLRARVGAGRHLGRRLSRERAPVVGVQLRGGARRRAHAPLRRARGGVRAPHRAAACRCPPTTRC